MMKKGRRNFRALAVFVFGFCCMACAQEKPPAPVRSWDLNVDADYAARMVKQLRIITLKSPTIVFLDNQKIAVTYEDGRGAFSSDGKVLGRNFPFPRTKVESPMYKFHALIFDVDIGPATANRLQWDAIREESQLLPTHDGGFAVRVDNQFMIYSNDAHLQNKMTLAYHGDKPLATGEEVFEESYKGAISHSGRSLVVCHELRGRHSGGGAQVTWYDTRTLKAIGKPSEVTREAGCGIYLNSADDNTVYSGSYKVDPETPVWTKINPRCMTCPPDPSQSPWQRFEVVAPGHFLIFGKNYEIVDENGYQDYVIPYEAGVGLAGPTPATSAPRIAYGDGQSKNESGHRWSTRLYVVDWKERRKIATLKFVQNALPAVHDGGLQLEALGMSDFSYALSPDGKKLAVLNRNSLEIYDLP
jgi:hypothetical protein